MLTAQGTGACCVELPELVEALAGRREDAGTNRTHSHTTSLMTINNVPTQPITQRRLQLPLECHLTQPLFSRVHFLQLGSSSAVSPIFLHHARSHIRLYTLFWPLPYSRRGPDRACHIACSMSTCIFLSLERTKAGNCNCLAEGCSSRASEVQRIHTHIITNIGVYTCVHTYTCTYTCTCR